MRSKVLIIAYYFPPFSVSLGSAIRMLKLAEYLKENGYEVYILTVQGEEANYYGYRELCSKFNITYMPSLFGKYLWKILASKLSYSNRRNTLLGSSCNFFKRIWDILCLMIGLCSYIIRTFLFARKMIIQNQIYNVYITSPLHISQVVGILLKKYFKNRICWFIEYRDSFHHLEGIWLGRLFYSIFSRCILKNCNYFIYCSRPIFERARQIYSRLEEKALFIGNGYDIEMRGITKCGGKNKEVLRVGYFGSLGANVDFRRDPALLFNILKKFKGRIILELYGYCRMPIGSDLSEIVRYCGNLDYSEAIKKMREMDLLLILILGRLGSSDEIITAKVYDYMLAEKPILVLGPKDMEVCKIIEKEKIGYSADIYNDLEATQLLEKLLFDREKGQLLRYSIEDLKEYKRQYQYSKLLPVLK